jgi:ferritin-like metal-binding protein YciE
MAAQKTLANAFYEGLKDIYFAERTSVRALKKAAKAAKDDALRQALELHGEESAAQLERLQQVFEIFGKAARGKTCEAIQGLMAELEEHIEDFGDSDAADAVLIAGAQAMEHYEIARYGTLRAWAGQLGLADAAKLLGQTLEEEEKTDQLLTELAQKLANQVAA